MARRHQIIVAAPHNGIVTAAMLGAAIVAWAPAHAACDLSRAPAVPVVKGLSYQQARQAILGGGWQAVAGHPHNDLSSNEVTFRDKGYTELQFCRLTADSLCRFRFSAGDVSLWVTTTGDENPLLDSTATVKAARLACASDPDPG
jgi:hypothetical protein